MGLMLRDYERKNYLLATTEAGLLPFYSHWRSLDTWGLNDEWIAHHGGLVTAEYLEKQKPDLIIWHGHFSPLQSMSHLQAISPWGIQVDVLKNYAEEHRFTLAAIYGSSPTDTHYYYVRANLPDHDQIVSKIQTVDYIWWGNGLPAKRYDIDGPPP